MNAKTVVVTPGTAGLAMVAIDALGTEHVDAGHSAFEPVRLVHIDPEVVLTAIDMVCAGAAHPELLTFRVDGQVVTPTWKRELLDTAADYAEVAPTEHARCPFGCSKTIAAPDILAHGNFGCRA